MITYTRGSSGIWNDTSRHVMWHVVNVCSCRALRCNAIRCKVFPGVCSDYLSREIGRVGPPGRPEATFKLGDFGLAAKLQQEDEAFGNILLQREIPYSIRDILIQ